MGCIKNMGAVFAVGLLRLRVIVKRYEKTGRFSSSCFFNSLVVINTRSEDSNVQCRK